LIDDGCEKKAARGMPKQLINDPQMGNFYNRFARATLGARQRSEIGRRGW
jgi:hypothetical protein